MWSKKRNLGRSGDLDGILLKPGLKWKHLSTKNQYIKVESARGAFWRQGKGGTKGENSGGWDRKEPGGGRIDIPSESAGEVSALGVHLRRNGTFTPCIPKVLKMDKRGRPGGVHVEEGEDLGG